MIDLLTFLTGFFSLWLFLVHLDYDRYYGVRPAIRVLLFSGTLFILLQVILG